MLKEFFAIMLLLGLLAAAIWNAHHIDAFTGELLTYIDNAEELERGGDFKGAAHEIEKAAARWQEAGGYTRVLLRQTEIDTVTDSFYGHLSDLYEESPGAAEASRENLRAHIKGVAEIEQVSWGSVF